MPHHVTGYPLGNPERDGKTDGTGQDDLFKILMGRDGPEMAGIPKTGVLITPLILNQS